MAAKQELRALELESSALAAATEAGQAGDEAGGAAQRQLGQRLDGYAARLHAAIMEVQDADAAADAATAAGRPAAEAAGAGGDGPTGSGSDKGLTRAQVALVRGVARSQAALWVQHTQPCSTHMAALRCAPGLDAAAAQRQGTACKPQAF